MKAIPQPQWVEDAPAWERREVARHLEPDTERLCTDFLESPLPLDRARDRRRNGEPLEYILGHCHVAGMTLEVNETVLVPRPETETLLRRFSDRLKELPSGPVVDCGTGSGLLAIGLARATDRTVLGTDVSPGALRVAQRNARRNSAEVNFLRGDRLEPLQGPLAGIVANLPYVLRGSPRLQSAVREHEPDDALFVPGDPGEFYRGFLNRALAVMKPGGELWMELDEELIEHLPVESLLDDRGSLDLREDDFGQLRFAVVSTGG